MEKEHWHLDKRLSIGHLITTFTVGISIIVYVLNLENNVDINANNIQHNKETIANTNKSLDKAIERIDENLEKIITILKDNK